MVWGWFGEVGPRVLCARDGALVMGGKGPVDGRAGVAGGWEEWAGEAPADMGV
jgi:hypothetical protein